MANDTFLEIIIKVCLSTIEEMPLLTLPPGALKNYDTHCSARQQHFSIPQWENSKDTAEPTQCQSRITLLTIDIPQKKKTVQKEKHERQSHLTAFNPIKVCCLSGVFSSAEFTHLEC